MALTLLRHAALAKKHQGRYNGWSNLNIDLSLFDEKSIALLKHQTFDIVYSSDLQRCTQTLDEIGITYTTDPRLREVKFKDEIEGLNFQEVEQLKSYDENNLNTRDKWHAYICEESQSTFELRIKSFLSELDTDKEILICSHAGTLQKMMVMLGYAKNKIEYLEQIRVDNIRIENVI